MAAFDFEARNYIDMLSLERLSCFFPMRSLIIALMFSFSNFSSS